MDLPRGFVGPARRLSRAWGPAAGRAVFSLFALALAACGSDAPTGQGGAAPPAVGKSDSEEALVYRGHASYGHEVRSFRPCGEEDALWARDPSGYLWDLHAELAPGLEPYEEIFALVRGVEGPPPAEGFGADYPGEILVGEVLYAACEGLGCDFDWPRFRYRAQGNEPFWWAEVTPGGLRVGLLGEEDRSWPELREVSEEGRLSFIAEGGPGSTAELRLLPEPCRDSMSGAYFGSSAVLSLGDRELRGCALPGSALPD